MACKRADYVARLVRSDPSERTRVYPFRTSELDAPQLLELIAWHGKR